MRVVFKRLARRKNKGAKSYTLNIFAIDLDSPASKYRIQNIFGIDILFIKFSRARKGPLLSMPGSHRAIHMDCLQVPRLRSHPEKLPMDVIAGNICYLLAESYHLETAELIDGLA